MKKRFLLALVINSFLAGILFVYADWTPPPATPPTCPTTNPACNTPINVGTLPQAKQAGLIISNLPPPLGQPGFAVLQGNVGIGTVSPTSRLHVVGDTRITGHIGLSDLAPSAFSQITSQDTQTDPSGDPVGSRFVNYTDTTVSVLRNLYGSLSYAIPRPAVGTTNSGTGIGMYGIGRADGAGAMTTLEGVRGLAQSNNATAAVTSAIGLRAYVTQTTGTITNGYGVRIEDVQGTNQYGLYQVGSTDANYFAGNVGIGDPTPAYKLDVTGDINSTGVYRVDGIAGVSGPVTCAAGFTPNNITINGGIVTAAGACTAIGGGGGLTGTGLAGQVTFWNSATNLVGDSNLFWDTTNNRLGIGDATPAATLTVGAGDLFQVTSAGLVRTPNGSFGTPAYSFVGDANSGMYSGGTDILRLVTTGVDRMTINAAGKVGIGTISPDSRPDVKLDVGTNVVDGSGNVIGNIIAGVKLPLNGTDAANRDYVDAQLGQPQTKVVKEFNTIAGASLPPLDCGAGYIIRHCSFSSDINANVAQFDVSYLFQGMSHAPSGFAPACAGRPPTMCNVCPFSALGSQSFPIPRNNALYPYAAGVAECVRQ